MGVRPEWTCAETTEPAFQGLQWAFEGKGPPSKVQVQVGRRVGEWSQEEAPRQEVQGSHSSIPPSHRSSCLATACRHCGSQDP